MVQRIFQSNNVTNDYSMDRIKYIETASYDTRPMLKKKWYGNNVNRDASNIVAKEKTNNVGYVLLKLYFFP